MNNDAPIHECESGINHYTDHCVPYSLRRVCGFFNVPQIYYMARACETGPTVYRPYPRRLESQTVCRCYTKAALSPQLSLKRPWVLLRPGSEPTASRSADWRLSLWANRAAVLKLWTDNHYLHQNILKGLLKRNFSTASVGGWKAKLWCYRLIWITHLATIERPWIEKLTGILSGSPLSARIKDGLFKWRTSTVGEYMGKWNK